MNLNTNRNIIFLIGFMGSGKSTVGKRLAKEKGWAFIDLDEVIIKKTGQSIATIFEEKGEVEFRNLEKKYLREIPLDKPIVIATGGGTPCFHNNMEFMNRMGHTIYLKQSVEVLLGRLIKEKKHRPIIKNLEDKELEDFISRKLQEREVYYNRCKEII